MKPALRSRVPRIAGAVVCALTPAAVAGGIPGDPAMMLEWACVQQYDPSFNVRCTPQLAGPTRGTFSIRWSSLFWEDITGPASEPPRALAGAARKRDFRPVAIRGRDEIFSGHAWYVPMHAAPRDAAHVAVALRSALCGAVPSCRVIYTSSAAGRPAE